MVRFILEKRVADQGERQRDQDDPAGYPIERDHEQRHHDRLDHADEHQLDDDHADGLEVADNRRQSAGDLSEPVGVEKAHAGLFQLVADLEPVLGAHRVGRNIFIPVREVPANDFPDDAEKRGEENLDDVPCSDRAAFEKIFKQFQQQEHRRA